ncbi:MAG: hypothetical protein VB878_18595 [Pirellulaceae bacterium]
MKIEPDGLEMRFSLRGLLIVLTGVSVCSALLFSVPDSIGLLLLVFLAVAVPAALTAGAVYRRGAWRAFCIGGLFPSGLLLYVTGWMFGLSIIETPGLIRSVSEWREFSDVVGVQFRVYSASAWLMIALLGTLVVIVRRIATR